MPVPIPFDTCGQEIIPCFFSEADHPFLRSLLECFSHMVGEAERTLEEALVNLEDERITNPRKRLWAREHLWRTWPRAIPEAPRRIRRAVFLAAAARDTDRPTILEKCGAKLKLSASQVEQALFADVPGERRLGKYSPPSLNELCLRLNLSIVQALLAGAGRVRLRLDGQARPVVRHARLRGLMCTVEKQDGKTVIDISGPYSLFRRTLVYGRRLGDIVPLLAWCDRFWLDADCAVGRGQSPIGSAGSLRLRTGAPIMPSSQPKHFDSLLEERFAKDFCRATRDWSLVREPEPLPLGNALLFPDFVARDRHSDLECFIEIVGFWTPDYIERKLRQYRQVKVQNLILCVEELSNCSDVAMPPGVAVIPFRRRIKVAAVLTKLGELRGQGQSALSA